MVKYQFLDLFAPVFKSKLEQMFSEGYEVVYNIDTYVYNGDVYHTAVLRLEEYESLTDEVNKLKSEGLGVMSMSEYKRKQNEK